MRGLVGQGADGGARRLDKARDDQCVDRIGLGALAQSLREGANLGRIDDDDRQTRARLSRRDNAFETTGRLQGDRRHLVFRQSGDEFVDARASASHGGTLSQGEHAHPTDPLKHRCRRRSRPSCPVLAICFASGPCDCGSMERRTRNQASGRAPSPRLDGSRVRHRILSIADGGNQLKAQRRVCLGISR